ncbi:hypothetical protein [Sutcliffiella halmapala]|uniref:hypothetical protein n=1 Tax=Sutcliffiella halmapala TaxID=79882 RepID=UPI00099515DC|nr:hypothetical protein [Sutcliffiella halmapala]
MQEKVETLEKMNVYATDLVKLLVKDGASIGEDKLKVALENVVRAMVDMTSIQLNPTKDANATLQATLSKMKIAHNCINPHSKDHLIKSFSLPKSQTKESNQKITIK